MGILPVFDEILNARRVLLIHVFVHVIILYVVFIALHRIVHGKYYSPLGINLRFFCCRFGWQLEDFLLGFVSLNANCF